MTQSAASAPFFAATDPSAQPQLDHTAMQPSSSPTPRQPLQPRMIPQPQAASPQPIPPSKLQRGEDVAVAAAAGAENNARSSRSVVHKIAAGGAGSDAPPLAPLPCAVDPVPSSQPQPPSALDNMWSRASAAAAAVKKEEEESGGGGGGDGAGKVVRITRVEAKAGGARASFIPDMPGRPCTAEMAPPVRTAFEMLQETRPRLAFGDEYLDGPLGGGLTEGITELVGEAAAGKTQMAMQLLLRCQLPPSEGGLGGGALFLAMEGEFPISRLRGMADAFQRAHPSIKHDVLNKIYIKTLNSPEELSVVLHHTLRVNLESGDIKLIVLDSVAGMFRTDYSGKEQDFSQRSQELLGMSAQLKQLSATYHVPVLVINQVTDFFAGSDANGGEGLRIEQVKHSYLHHWSVMSGNRRVLPALGLTWANCVNTRIFLTRKWEFVHSSSAIPQLGLMHPLRSADYSAGYNPLVNMFTPRGSGSMQSGTIGLMQPMQSMQQQQPQAPLSPVQAAAPATVSRRFMHVQFAPHLAPATAEFVIEASGVRGTANVDEVAQMIAMSPTASPSAAQHTQAWEAAPSSASSVPMLQPLGGFASGAAAAGAPVLTSFSYTRNMFTPSGNSAASSPSLSRQAGGAPSSSPSAGSRFDDDDRTPQQREADERAELQMLAQAEEAMQIRQQQQAAANDLPVRSVDSLFNSPTIQQQPQQQPRPNYWD